jgi:hypothetical protein
MQHVARRDAVAAECSRVGVVANFENATANGFSMAAKKKVDVVAVDRLAAVEPEVAADGRCSP